MSMMRLLSAGKSLVGLHDSGKQYRMSAPQALPKFGSGPNAFRARSREAIPQTPAPEPRKSVAATPVAAAKAALPGAARERKGQGIPGDWFAKLRALVPRSQRASKPSPVRFSSGPVQGELSLDNVKVLRNDLSDTDFEVVTKPAASARPEAAPTQTPGGQPGQQKIWNRVTTLLGSGQT
jgi:hypothetical protein